MIEKDGSYRCDFCGYADRESGQFYTATGNHISCTELRERVRLERENKRLRRENATLRAENARLKDEALRLEYKQP